jgi:hypothetical protein
MRGPRAQRSMESVLQLNVNEQNWMTLDQFNETVRGAISSTPTNLQFYTPSTLD